MPTVSYSYVAKHVYQNCTHVYDRATWLGCDQACVCTVYMNHCLLSCSRNITYQTRIDPLLEIVLTCELIYMREKHKVRVTYVWHFRISGIFDIPSFDETTSKNLIFCGKTTLHRDSISFFFCTEKSMVMGVVCYSINVFSHLCEYVNLCGVICEFVWR